MALETLKGVEKIGGFEVGHAEKAWEDGNSGMEDIANFNNKFVTVNHIGFRIQDGPIKENGINGAQVDTLIEAARLILVGLNKKESHSPHKNNAIAHLFSAMSCLEHDILEGRRERLKRTMHDDK